MEEQNRVEGSSSELQNKEKQSENDGSAANKVSFYKLFSFADSADKALMIIGSIGAAVNGLAIPLLGVLFGQAMDAFGHNKNNKRVIHDVSLICLKFLYMAIGVAVGGFLQVACWMVTGERQATRIRNLYLKAILRQDIAFFDKETNTGEVVSRISGDTVLVQDAIGEKVGKFIQLMSTFIGGFVIAFINGWLLAVVLLSCIPFLAAAGLSMTIVVSRMATKGQAAYAKAAVIVEQTIGSIRTVASFTGEERAVADYDRATTSAYKSGVLQGLASGIGLGAALFIVFGTFALTVWFGSRLVLDKHYSGGTIINVLIGVLTGSMALGESSPCLSAFTAGQAAALKMFETINRIPVIDPYEHAGRVLEDIQGEIELRDVYFSYPARPSEQIFSGFSLSVPSGTTAALVGQSGSGKSTVISLIERFYDPQVGQVIIDGINLKKFQLKWIRQKISLVSQEPVLFASSIKENILYGKSGATTEEIRIAAEIANAAKFIDELPQGLDTLVGEHGTQLSGGQKQSVAIARAILRNPRILLLDEATSALDAESERIVQEALERIMVNRTTIIVAHRLSTVRNADMIAVLHQGKVVEKGTHSELLKDPVGAYSQLVSLQEMREESEHSEATREIPGQSSHEELSLRTLNHNSSRRVNSSRHSFRVGGDPLAPLTEPSQVSIRRLAYLNKPEIPFLLSGLISAIAAGVIFPVYSILLSSAVHTFYEPPHELRRDSRFWALMFLLLGLASLVSHPAQAYFFAVAGCKLIRRIRLMCFERIVHMEVVWFDDPDNASGAIGARLSADVASVRTLVGDALGLLIQNLATAVACLLIAFLSSWMLTLIILLLTPLLGLNGFFHMKFLRGFSGDAKKQYGEATQVASDAVRSIRTVASFCAEEKVLETFEKKCEGPKNTGIKQGLISGMGYGMSFFLLYCVYAASFYAGAQLVGHGKATFKEVFRVLLALILAAVGISQSSSLAPNSGKAKSAAASVFSFLDRKSTIDSSDAHGITIDNVKGEIEFQHVSFTYPRRPDIVIFKDLCLIVPPGKTVALVGQSGSGKSTVISLLQRFYEPNSGSITLDGIEIQKLQLKWFRQQMGLVSQEPVLFNETIRSNIAYGKGADATESEIRLAAKLANADKFISCLQQGYDTIVGERGVRLSGGQKQRIAIARAMVKNPKILLLDEATSALDGESERVVQEALDQVMVDRTSVVVAHRLSTIKHADMIAVVKDGVIEERGSHDALVRIKDGVYASLVALQMSALS